MSLGLFLAYLLAARLGMSMASAGRNVSTVFPAAAVALWGLSVFGAGFWPAIALAAFGLSFRTGEPWWTAMLVSSGVTAAAASGAWFLRKSPFNPALRSIWHLGLLAVAIMLSAALSSSIGVAALSRVGMLEDLAPGLAWKLWFIGDGMGMVLLAPFLFAIQARPRSRPGWRVVVEAGLVAAVTVATALTVFDESRGFPFEVFLPIAWAIVRFDIRLVSAQILIVGGIAIGATQSGQSQFAGATPAESLEALYRFLLVLGLTAPLLSLALEERGKAVAASRKHAVRFRDLFESAPDATILADMDGSIVRVNQRVREIFGWPGDELLGQPLGVLIPDLTWATEWAGRDCEALRRDGSTFPAEIRMSVLRFADDPAVVVSIRDVTERHRAQAREREVREDLERAQELARLGSWRIRARTHEGHWSREMFRLHHLTYRSAAPSENEFFDAVHPEDRELLMEARRSIRSGGASATVTYRTNPSNGPERMLEGQIHGVRDDSGEIVAWDGTAMDITDRRRLEAQFLQAQKLEVVGQLASGIAHDFNNLLTVMISTAEMTAVELGSDHPVAEDLAEIRMAAQRSAELTRQLLAFSRRQILRPRVLDLNRMISGMKGMLKRMITSEVEISLSLADDLAHVRADPGQIDQVLANLAVNARDAMPGGGTLSIETSNATLSAPTPFGSETLGPGRFTVVRVSDTGEGIERAVRDRIFEPFFTTKGPGHGTGLGLSTVYGIVRQSEGAIRVESQPGAGTTFEIYLPAVSGPASNLAEPTVAIVPGRNETILVVDDEPPLRRVAAMVLSSAGYNVLTSGSGQAALDILEERPEPVDMIFTDLVMPDMSGLALTERVRSSHPEVKVLLTSGFADREVAGSDTLDDSISFLSKPYTIHELTTRVRRLLES